MARQAKIVLVGGTSPATQRLVNGLGAQAIPVHALPSLPDPHEPASEDSTTPDLLLVDAVAAGPAVVDTVRRCRERWPQPTLPLLVLGSPDAETSAAVIDAGATDSVEGVAGGALIAAHVRRLLRTSESLQELLSEERRRAKQESLVRAAADMAVPLGALLDELEAIMLRAPVNEPLDELLDLTARAVDAVDRLRRMALTERTAEREA